MKIIIIWSILLALVSCTSINDLKVANYKKEYQLSELVASSYLVIEGKLNLPSNNLTKEKFIDLVVDVSNVLKGDNKLIGKKIKIKYFYGNYSNQPSWKTIQSSNQNKVLVYLRDNNDLVEVVNAIEKYSEKKENQIFHEIKMEKEILKYDFSNFFKDKALEKEAKNFIEKLVISKDAKEIFLLYTSFDQTIVPYLIMNMEDFRELKYKNITVKGSWELTHYRVEKVIDALSVILSQLEKKSFDSLLFDVTDVKRKQVLNTWKVWLYRNNHLLQVKNGLGL